MPVSCCAPHAPAPQHPRSAGAPRLARAAQRAHARVIAAPGAGASAAAACAAGRTLPRSAAQPAVCKLVAIPAPRALGRRICVMRAGAGQKKNVSGDQSQDDGNKVRLL
jgi:hypothetical protein